MKEDDGDDKGEIVRMIMIRKIAIMIIMMNKSEK